jgi:hypothetical protein
MLSKPKVSTNKSAKCKRRKAGTLAIMLDRALEPRVPPGRRGRPKGSPNYVWPPELDQTLIDLSRRCSPPVVKKVMRAKLLDMRGGSGGCRPRPDSLRKQIERRMAGLNLPTGKPRKKQEKTAKAWTETQTQALLGVVGTDLQDKTIEERTEHTVEAARAKLKLLGYAAHEMRGVAYTIQELAEKLQVSVRKIRRWKENGWLRTIRYRVSEVNLQEFIKAHHALIPFKLLDCCKRLWLMALGYPAPETRKFHAAAKSVMETVAGRKKRKDAGVADLDATPVPASAPAPSWRQSILSKVTKVASAVTRWKRDYDELKAVCPTPTNGAFMFSSSPIPAPA